MRTLIEEATVDWYDELGLGQNVLVLVGVDRTVWADTCRSGAS
jgi:hypothetical protein